MPFCRLLLSISSLHPPSLGQARFTIGAAYQILMGRTTRAAVAYVPRDYHSEEGQVGAGGLASRHEGEFTEISCPLLEAVPGKFDPGLDLSALPAPWRALEREDFQLFVAANVACMSMEDRVAPTQDPSSRHLSLGKREREREMDRGTLLFHSPLPPPSPHSLFQSITHPFTHLTQMLTKH